MAGQLRCRTQWFLPGLVWPSSVLLVEWPCGPHVRWASPEENLLWGTEAWQTPLRWSELFQGLLKNLSKRVLHWSCSLGVPRIRLLHMVQQYPGWGSGLRTINSVRPLRSMQNKRQVPTLLRFYPCSDACVSVSILRLELYDMNWHNHSFLGSFPGSNFMTLWSSSATMDERYYHTIYNIYRE